MSESVPLWTAGRPDDGRRRSPRSTRHCCLCEHEPESSTEPMYRTTLSLASWDPGKIVLWLCPDCFALVDQAIRRARAALAQGAAVR